MKTLNNKPIHCPIQALQRDEKQSHSFPADPLYAVTLGFESRWEFFAQVLELENLKGTWPNLS